ATRIPGRMTNLMHLHKEGARPSHLEQRKRRLPGRGASFLKSYGCGFGIRDLKKLSGGIPCPMPLPWSLKPTKLVQCILGTPICWQLCSTGRRKLVQVRGNLCRFAVDLSGTHA